MTAIAKLEPLRNYELVPDGFDMVLEAREIFSNDEGLLIAHTAGTVRQGITPVRIMNASESEVRLKGKSILGSFYAAMPENVKVARVGFYEFVEEKCDVSISMAQAAKPACAKEFSPAITLNHSVLNVSQQRKANAFFSRFSDIFSDSKAYIGRTDLIRHNIDRGDSRPIKQPPRCIPYDMWEEVGEQVKEMLNDDIIEPGRNPWSSPVVLVREKKMGLCGFAFTIGNLMRSPIKMHIRYPKWMIVWIESVQHT